MTVCYAFTATMAANAISAGLTYCSNNSAALCNFCLCTQTGYGNLGGGGVGYQPGEVLNIS